MSTVGLNIKEYINDLVAVGVDRKKALKMARAEMDKRKATLVLYKIKRRKGGRKQAEAKEFNRLI